MGSVIWFDLLLQLVGYSFWLYFFLTPSKQQKEHFIAALVSQAGVQYL